ncbi:MAG: extracellular solute-binding protein [Alphaproteobacteria bacterium]|nr:extracellular solute-binding protein [Alphaproteobacteria bacterium]
MSLHRRSLLAGTAALTLAGAARAQIRPPSDADWQKVIEAARKEGEVSYYSSGIARIEEPQMKQFEKDTGLKVKYARPGGAEIIVKKLQAEIAAGKPLADIATMTDKALGAWAEQEGMTAPMAIPALGRIDPAYPVDSLHNLPTGGFGLPIIYNTRMLSADKAPKSYAELADPRFKDQILLGAPENAGSTTVLIKAWLDRFGWDYVEKLRRNGVAETRLQAEAAQAVARGEKPICVVAQAWAFTNIKQGAPLAVIWPEEGVAFTETSFFRLKNGPNPNAALVLANYMMTAEYQSANIKNAGVYGSIKGADQPELFPPISQLKRMQFNQAELIKQRGAIIDRWRKIMS